MPGETELDERDIRIDSYVAGRTHYMMITHLPTNIVVRGGMGPEYEGIKGRRKLLEELRHAVLAKRPPEGESQ